MPCCGGCRPQQPDDSGPKQDAVAKPIGSLDSMRISEELLDEMVAHARVEAPNECCGMVASRDGELVEVHQAMNAAASPLRYEIDGAEQYRIQMAIDDAGLDLGAIYHSHTRSEPYPSQTDINLAFYPDALYLIVGLVGGEADVRAYTIRDGQVAPAELVVE
jgi:[CysO sulfur-carrier protein]-S-L-cysteine hydrolase